MFLSIRVWLLLLDLLGTTSASQGLFDQVDLACGYFRGENLASNSVVADFPSVYL